MTNNQVSDLMIMIRVEQHEDYQAVDHLIIGGAVLKINEIAPF
jgi:hypothetical protein